MFVCVYGYGARGVGVDGGKVSLLVSHFRPICNARRLVLTSEVENLERTHTHCVHTDIGRVLAPETGHEK
jgi:hypothetical protein